ncbi:MAG: AI-2E family transporter [Chloroflexota bacterium]
MGDNSSNSLSILILPLALLLTGYLMIIGKEILLPFVIAIIIWRVLVGLTETIHRQRIGSFQPPYWLSILTLVVMFAFFFQLTIDIFVDEIQEFIESLPHHQDNLVALLGTLPPRVLEAIPAFSTGDIENGLNTLLINLFNSLSAYISTIGTNVVSLISQTSVVAIYVIFLLLEQNTFAKKMIAMFPDQTVRKDMSEILKSIGDNITDYIGIKTWISLLLAVVLFVIMLLMGLEHAVVWAILSFFLNFIPFIGPLIAIIFPALTAILTSTNWVWIIGVTVAVSVVQGIFGYAIEPKMMGNRLGVSPLIVLLALAVFGAIWGLAGMFLSVPLVVIMIIILGHFQRTRPIAIMLSEDGQIPEVDHTH